MNSEIIHCKYCNSPNVIKFGTHEGIQWYWCKVCKRKFVPNNALPKMKTSVTPIASAMSCYFGGMPLDAIQRHLQQQYDLYMSESGIYYWVARFSKEAVKRAKEFKPDVGETWVADETVIKVGGKNIWLFDVIDKRSRYLLASRLATQRTIKEVVLVMKEARDAAGKTPKKIITDRLAAYVDGIELVFGTDTEHVQSKPFVDKDSTNIIERFRGTMKDRTNVIRGFKNMGNANLLTDAWLVHYNFFKEHEALGNVPPAQKMKIPVPFKDWNDVLKSVKADMVKVKTTSPISYAKVPRITKPTPRITPKPVRQKGPLTKQRETPLLKHGAYVKRSIA